MLGILLRLLVVLGLAVDAVVHLRLASGYQAAAPGGIGEGTLFRIEAGVAIAVTLAVLVRPGRVVSALAFLVAAAALGAVLLYRYVDVPAIGPLPSMYEPVWFGEKTLSAVAEAVAGLGSLVLLRMAWRRPRDGAIAGAEGPGTSPRTSRRRVTSLSSGSAATEGSRTRTSAHATGRCVRGETDRRARAQTAIGDPRRQAVTASRYN